MLDNEIAMFWGIVVGVVIIFASAFLIHDVIEHRQQIQCIEVGGVIDQGVCKKGEFVNR